MRILVLGDMHGQFSSTLNRRIEKERKRGNFDFVIGVGDYAGIKEWQEYFMVMFKATSKGLPWISTEEYFGKDRYNNLVKKDEKHTKRVLEEMNDLGKDKKVFFVFGNNDDDWYNYPFSSRIRVKKSRKSFLRKLKNMKNITYSYAKFNGVLITGFGGYMDVRANWMRRKDDVEEYERMIKRVKKSRIKLFEICKKVKPEILVLHYPPNGVFDIIKDRKNPYHEKSAGILAFRDAILKFRPKLVLCGHMHEYQGARKLGKSIVVNPGDGGDNKFAIIDYPIDEEGRLDGDIKVRFVK